MGDARRWPAWPWGALQMFGGGFGGGGDVALIFVNDAAACSALPISDSGAYVRSFRDIFIYRAASTATVDNITVLAAVGGVGRWERMCIGNASWAAQADWWVNETTGNDENTGAAVGAPIKTLRELQRRIGSNAITQNTTVNITSFLTAANAANIRFLMGGAFGMYIKGAMTQLFTGAVTTWTPLNRTTEGNLITVAGFNWAAGAVSKVLRFTSGALTGYSTFVADDLGANTARLGPLIQDVGAFTTNTIPVLAAVNPAPGDTFEILEPQDVLRSSFAMDGAFAGGTVRYLQIDGLRMDSTLVGVSGTASSCSLRAGTGVRLYVSRTDVNLAALDGLGVASNCRWSGGYPFSSGANGNVSVVGGVSFGVMQVAAGARIDGDILMRGPLHVGRTAASMSAWAGGCRLANACFVGITGDAILVGPNGYLQIRPGNYTTGIVYGAGNTGYGINVMGGGKCTYQTKPVVNAGLGVGRETKIGGVDTLYAAVPAVTAANLAMITVEAA